MDTDFLKKERCVTDISSSLFYFFVTLDSYNKQAVAYITTPIPMACTSHLHVVVFLQSVGDSLQCT